MQATIGTSAAARLAGSAKQPYWVPAACWPSGAPGHPAPSRLVEPFGQPRAQLRDSEIKGDGQHLG